MNRISALCVLALVAMLLAGCATYEPKSCSELKVGQADAAVLILTDVASQSFKTVVDQIADDPQGAFTAQDLHLNASPGIVVLETYDAGGHTTPVGKFNLGGVGIDDTRRHGDAKTQAKCLKEAAAAIPPQGPGGDLLRSLPSAAAVASANAGSHGAAVVAFGLGRSGGDGFEAATADFGNAESRRHVMDELGRVGLIPNFTAPAPALLLMDSTEGIQSGVSAVGVKAFAGDLCTKLMPAQCKPLDVLSLKPEAQQ